MGGETRDLRASSSHDEGNTQAIDHQHLIGATAFPAAAIAKLEKRIRQDLELLNYPDKAWLKPHSTPDGEPILDVLIVGGGQAGITLSHCLKRECVTNVLMIDENAPGNEGPWSTFARMPTLRTPKNTTGPDMGVPSLTYRAWFEVQYGRKAWEKITYVNARSWHQYLNWLRDLLELPVEHHEKCLKIDYVEGDAASNVPPHYIVQVHNTLTGVDKVRYARKVVLATGIDGCGEWHIPSYIKALPKHLYGHTREMIDFEQLRGKRVGILGAGASAFDNGSVALESGAADVSLFFRRDTLPKVNVYKWMGFSGFHQHHCGLGDTLRWKFMHKVLQRGQLPPTDTFNRATRHPNFRLHGGSPWTAVEVVDDGAAVKVTTPKGEFVFDYLIIATGFTTDLTLRKELSSFSDDVLLWRDVYTPSAELANDDMGSHPYLSNSFQFLSRSEKAVTKPLEGLFCFTFGGFVSHGVSGASITALRWSVPTVTRGILQSLYSDDAEGHYDALCNFNLQEY
jgi:cation diffusion facilitator CzcD-associated flavoprotein CzcO